jgi:hypothetical protein
MGATRACQGLDDPRHASPTPRRRAAAVACGAARGSPVDRRRAAGVDRSGRGGAPGARRRRGRNGSGRCLGGARRSLPPARRAGRGSRNAGAPRHASGWPRDSPSSSPTCARGSPRGRGSRSRGLTSGSNAGGRSTRLKRWRRFAGDSCTRMAARPADFRAWFSWGALRVVKARALFDSLGGRAGGDRRRRSRLLRPCGRPVVPEAYPRAGTAAAGVRRLRDGVPRARPAGAATCARADREPWPRPLRGSCRRASRARRRDRGRTLGAQAKRQAARAACSRAIQPWKGGPRGAPERSRSTRRLPRARPGPQHQSN